MTITPKDWKTFQHYKDRRPPWIKLHRTLLDNADFHRLPDASRALAPMLWLLAAEHDEGAITENEEDIAWRFRMSLDAFKAALRPLISKGFFITSDAASAPLAPCKRDAMPETEGETEAETKTDTRAKRPVSEPKQIDLEEAIAAKAKSSPSRFDEFWQAYPRREGPNPRQPAEKKFNALVKSGADPEMMIAAAKKLAADESARGNIATRFIPQAITWLNQQRWADHAAVAALVEMTGADLPIENAVKMFAKMGFWSRHAGPSPGQLGCRASDELLAKYGLDPLGRKLEPEGV